ncbi:MAG: sensor histidine kinase KdpD [Gemmatimonadales bacterium]|nr:sensor histidine kinase KdpD [Gemmatimonadales bacterium]
MTDAARPDPDALLARVQQDAVRAERGRLKIFLGASPGVGKTFAMLEAAQLAHAAGADVVVGVLETHGRRDTAALLDGLEQLPRIAMMHRGVALEEFDLEAALVRRPAILLMDELAHTNAPGTRHAKRWQDVRELLAVGIDVHTTLNIQHVESLNDVVAQITGVTVRETVPDAMLDDADEIELVDVSPDVLLTRLREGKVYLPAQAERAAERFFKRGNLMALRELALRRTAERVDAEMRDWRSEAGVQGMWPAGERVLVAVAPTPDAPRLVRAGWRLAVALRAECLVLHVETAEVRRSSAEMRESVQAALRLAQELGARVATVTGDDVGHELLAWARRENVTRIVVGRSRRTGWLQRLQPSPVDRLLGGHDGLDVHVLAPRGPAPSTARPERPTAEVRMTGREALGAVAWVTGAALLGLALRGIVSTTDIAMLFLLAITVAGLRARRAASVLAAVVGIALFDLLFVPPYGTFAISDASYLLTFVVMLAVALAMTHLMGQLREGAEAARARERRTAALLDLAQELALAGTEEVVGIAVQRRLADSIGAEVSIVLTDGNGGLQPLVTSAVPLDERELAVARWAVQRREAAGLGTATLPTASARWIPLPVGDQVIGAMGVRMPDGDPIRAPDRRLFLEAVAGQAAVALERLRLVDRTQRDRVEIEAERLRTALLSSLSHDLRTPLAGVEGAATTLLRDDLATDPATRHELLETVRDEARRMARLVSNLLEMVRVESGSLQVQREWQALEEIVGVALLRCEPFLGGMTVTTNLPADLPMLRVDGLLLEQVFVNLLENASRYAVAGGEVQIGARQLGAELEVVVEDRGPGVAAGEEEAIFEKFARGGHATGGGVGLGLAICRGIVTAHGGRIRAERREGGGLRMIVTLPLPSEQPLAPPEVSS